jgi:predicted nuclease with TOPRIM domain
MEQAFSLMEDYATPLIALVGTIFGGVGLKVVERWLNRAKDKSDAAKEIRDELRSDMATYRAEILELKKETEKLDEQVILWQEKYFELRDKYSTLKALYEDALRQIQAKANQTVRAAHDAGIDLPPAPVVESVTSKPTD